jgi:hypothetical protein
MNKTPEQQMVLRMRSNTALTCSLFQEELASMTLNANGEPGARPLLANLDVSPASGREWPLIQVIVQNPLTGANTVAFTFVPDQHQLGQLCSALANTSNAVQAQRRRRD